MAAPAASVVVPPTRQLPEHTDQMRMDGPSGIDGSTDSGELVGIVRKEGQPPVVPQHDVHLDPLKNRGERSLRTS